MKTKSPTSAAFFNPRFITGVALCFLGIALAFSAFRTASAQGRPDAPIIKGQFKGVLPVVQFDVSPPLRDMQIVPPDFGTKRENEDREIVPIRIRFAPEWDRVVQTTVGGADRSVQIPGPVASFDAQNSNSSPPDPNGAAGPNHVVTMSNLSFIILNRTGAILFGPAANNTLWSGFGGPCQTENAGDPVVLYDRLADRWFLSQFTSAGPQFFFCVAVSTSPDPTGTYYRYAISTGTNFPDYPKASVWPDAYYVSTREFAGGSGGPFAGVGAYALNRAQALAGIPAAQVIGLIAPPGGTPYNVGDGLLPADMDGMTPPPVGSPNYFVGSMDNNGPYGAPQDALTLWKFTANFTNPPSSSFVLANTIPITPYNSILGLCGGSRACIPQPGTANRIDHLGYRQRPTFRLAYRNFGAYEALVTNQSVSGGTGPGGEVSGIRWWELRSPNSSPVLFQEGTFAPGVTDGIHRWMGSIAMDSEGDIGLAYSASNATLFPSIYYTGRRPTDPAGTMAQGEAAIHTGTGSQTGGGNRWGDYTSITIDPIDDNTFWVTNMYLPVTTATATRLRVGAFNFAQNPPAPKGTGHFVVSECGGAGLAGAVVTINGSVYGATITGGVYDAPLAPGNYSYTVTKPTFTSASGNFTVTNGATTTVTPPCLQGPPIMVAADKGIIAAGANGVLDPGETVTVALGIRNISGSSTACTTAALTGTLLPTGGVTSPTGPQNYGVMCGASSPIVYRQFTFTVDGSLACGAPVTASLTITDGATNYGTFVFVFSTGSVLGVVQNFDTVTVPTLPPGWAATQGVNAGGSPFWVTSNAGTPTPAAFSLPNSVFTPDPASLLDNRLDTPPFTYGAGQTLKFQHNFTLEQQTAAAAYDAGVLEISINGGAFADIVTAGGSFVTGGYNHTSINTGFSNPLLPSRPNWSGASAGFVPVEVNMPPAGVGLPVVLRWRMGSDSTVASVGWRIDDVQIGSPPACGGSAPTVANAVSRKTHGAAGDFDVPLPLVPFTGAVGVESRGTNGVHQIVVTFNNPISVSSTAVTTGTGTATASAAGNVVTVNLSGVTDAQRMAVTLMGVSDGANLGNVQVPMGLLLGDTSGNGQVSAADISQTKAAAAVGTVDAGSFRTDVNANGTVNTTDIAIVKARSGTVLP